MYLLNEFARTVGAKDKKDRKRKALQIAGGIAGAALLGGLAYKNKGKLGQLFKKKPLATVAKETPKPMLALPAAGQSSSPINKVKNELDDIFIEFSENMYLLNSFSRKQRKDKGNKRQPYNKLSTKVKNTNTKMLYESYGGDKAASELANNPNNKLNKTLAKQYLRDVATSYDKANYEDKDVNVGLNKVNKKYNKYFK